jgi:hypothetical protein
MQISYLCIGVVALLLRTLDLRISVHTDEVNFWFVRSYTFINALEAGNFADTAISTHPGVTTTWCGSLGILLRRVLLSSGILTDTTFPTELVVLRLPAVAVHVVVILVGYTLLRRMFPAAVAFLGALLWATDPFTTGLSRVLHVDALAGTFATLSLLAACAVWQSPSPPYPRERGTTPWLLLALSGSAGALAVLSKSPGLAVVPVVGALALRAWSMERGPWNIGQTMRHLVLWGATFALTIVVAWPAVWAAPEQVYNLLRVGVEVEGASRHVVPNYFLGEMNPAPGALFYPVALALRTTPWALAGLLLLPFAAWPYRGERALPTLRTLAALAGLVLLFVVGLSLFPKKLDRYLVVAFPAANILAAVGLAWGAEQLPRLARLGEHSRAWGASLLISLVALVALLNAAWWHPYGIAYFNQMLGGNKRGVQTFLAGEGEGLGEAAAWLNQQPDITGVKVTSTMESSLQASLRKGAQAVSEKGTQLEDKTGYVVVYIRHMQRWQLSSPPPPYDRFYGKVEPVHVVKIHGVDYVHIYQVPPPVEHVVEVDFGPSIQLYGYEVNTPPLAESLTASNHISLTVQWRARAPVAEEYHMFVHLFDEEGQQVGHVDVPPGGPHAPTITWEPGSYVTWTHPLPIAAPPPDKLSWLALGLYHPTTFQRLPVGVPAPRGAPDDGKDVLFLKPVTIE